MAALGQCHWRIGKGHWAIGLGDLSHYTGNFLKVGSEGLNTSLRIHMSMHRIELDGDMFEWDDERQRWVRVMEWTCETGKPVEQGSE